LSFILGAHIADVPYLVAECAKPHPSQEIGDGQVFTQPWAGLGGQRRDQVIFYQYRAHRARRSLHGIDEQIAKAEKHTAPAGAPLGSSAWLITARPQPSTPGAPNG
jgi:hypothetical protein